MQINAYGDKLQRGNFVATDAMDVGDVSDRYDHAECQIVHAVYERGNEFAAEKNEPVFDNRVGYPDVKSTDGGFRAGMFGSGSNQRSGLNDPSPTPPQEVQEMLQQAEQESARLDSPSRTNDSTIAPDMPKQDILKGFHGG
ncbi:hypothetical protein [Oxalicibacterium solurbis]|uniref:Uncharacterized protein n=1 Tax=Oxalicibacterium solurbis TaxID=69280 RepID=A0A8J3F333_9BURK|nr:hypothetical protein [Oxalicibacterium solurbis]GGI53147.1 hypothetical protein GCM10011430_03210 [Oxalicibacterium solurbis]